jgi:hypothetical protein
VTKEVNGHEFCVPAPEERIVISTLQRIYRHFYFRLCDMADFASLLESGGVNFTEFRAAKAGGIWPGVTTFLLLVTKYAAAYGNSIDIPADVISSAYYAKYSCSSKRRFSSRPRAAGGAFVRIATANRKPASRSVRHVSLAAATSARADRALGLSIHWERQGHLVMFVKI